MTMCQFQGPGYQQVIDKLCNLNVDEFKWPNNESSRNDFCAVMADQSCADNPKDIQ